jgi:RNA polymerase sigma-70 factor (ECF subfamily)
MQTSPVAACRTCQEATARKEAEMASLDVAHAIDHRALDAESLRWVERLNADDATRLEAIADLHRRLRTEAVFQIRRRVRGRTRFPRSDIDDLAVQAADDALLAVLSKLDDYRGDSHFLTWARRFAALEAPVSIRRRIGRDRVGVSRDPDSQLRVADRSRPIPEQLATFELLDAVAGLIRDELTPRQRAILRAIVFDDVSTAALADELGMSSGAIYKALHDARSKLRSHTARQGLR